MPVIKTIEGNTSGGSTLVANGGGVARKSYSSDYKKINCIFYPKYREGEAQKVLMEARKWPGYLEKKSNSQLESFTANAGYNNYTYFAKVYKEKAGVNVQGCAWCDCFVDFVFIQALGVDRAKELLGGFSAYTPTSAGYLKKVAKQINKDEAYKYGGAIIFFNNSERICHTGIIDSDIKLEECEDTSYSKDSFLGDVYFILGVGTASAVLKKTVTLSKTKNKNHALVLPVQKYLKTLGYYTGVPDRDFGPLTYNAVVKYQNYIARSIQDGEITAKQKTWKSLLGLL